MTHRWSNEAEIRAAAEELTEYIMKDVFSKEDGLYEVIERCFYEVHVKNPDFMEEIFASGYVDNKRKESSGRASDDNE